VLGLGLSGRHGPLDSWIEDDIEKACRAAERLRLATVPTTKRFAGRFQDVVDANQARDKLAATMREFDPIEPDGSFHGGNFWRVATVDFSDGTRGPDPLAEYAVMGAERF
jgi:hypothetical protein